MTSVLDNLLLTLMIIYPEIGILRLLASAMVPCEMTKLEIVRGDITSQDVDAIVNAANTSLLGGAGVDGAIHAAAGPSILAECRLLGGCEVGEAKATGAGKLSNRHIIHTVGPRYSGGLNGEALLLESAHRRSIQVAAALGDKSIAFPAISCGIFGYPAEEAAPIALRSSLDEAETQGLELVRFVLFDDLLLNVFEQANSSLQS